MKIKVFEAFAGYGSQAMALNRLRENYPQFDYEVVGISEIDKYALQAYQAVHGHCPNYGDISKIDWNAVPDFDILTYSFPRTRHSTHLWQRSRLPTHR
jgi:DNA (cytosine-5)-methyltransferase 1